MALYNLDKDYEKEMADLFEKLSAYKFDYVSSIAVVMVVNDGEVALAHNAELLRDLTLMAGYMQMLATTRFTREREECVCNGNDEEDEDLDYQSDIGLTD